MGFFSWLRGVLFPPATPLPPGMTRAEARRRRQPDFLPKPRRRTPRRRRYARPEATFRPDELARFDLPALATVDDLAGALGITTGKLRWLTWPCRDRTCDHYVRRRVPKKSGGERLLCAPKAETRRAQDWIFHEILAHVPVSSAAHGFIRGRSILSNASAHVGRRIVVSMDLEDFFPSVSIATVVGLFEWLGYSKDVAWHLSMLCTCSYGRRRALPQGSPTSPAISNLICWKLDRRLTGLARKFGATYTRYGDDLTFSGDFNRPNRPGRLIGMARAIVSDEGFVVGRHKTRIMRHNRRQSVTGLVVNERPSLGRDEVRRLRAILHNCRVHGVESQNRDADELFKERLRGKIALVSMVNPDQGAKLLAAFQEVDWGATADLDG